MWLFSYLDIQYFNSQPHEEADPVLIWNLPPKTISTHSLTKRLTGTSFTTLLQSSYFNSQPHEEADRNFRQKYIYLKLFFMLIAHTNLVFLFKLLYCRFFSGKIHTFSGANVLKYFCKLTFRTIILKYL